MVAILGEDWLDVLIEGDGFRQLDRWCFRRCYRCLGCLHFLVRGVRRRLLAREDRQRAGRRESGREWKQAHFQTGLMRIPAIFDGFGSNVGLWRKLSGSPKSR